VAGTTVKTLLCAACFDALVKRWDKCISVGREINVFPRFQYCMFYFLYPIVTYLQTLPRIRYTTNLTA
jgi:hypothetical protein